MTTSIDKLIHKVNSSTANLTCILTNGIAYQFVYINSHEGWMCRMYNVREHCYSTRWTFSSCPIWNYVMYGNIFSASALNCRDLNCLLEIKVGTCISEIDTEIVCITFLMMTDPIKHLNKVRWRRIFLIALSQREGERGRSWGGEGGLYNLQIFHLYIITDL